MRITPIIDKVSVVLVGNFNPAIFSPGWFAMHDIVSKADAESAIVQIIHPDVCNFAVGEFVVQVDAERFTVNCAGHRHEMARDLVLGTFGTFLVHTPIRALGINREVDFDVGDFWVRDAVGERLAPKAAWGDWGPQISGPQEISADHGGLRSIVMRQGRPGHRYRGHIQAEVRPSARQQLLETGIFVSINNHYQLASDDKAASVQEMIDAITSEWGVAIEKADFIVDQVQRLVDECRNEGEGK